MSIDWDEINLEIVPVKDYEELCRGFQESFSYSFVRKNYNFSIPELADYTRFLLGGDPRARYTEYASLLTRIFTELHQAGILNILALIAQTETRELLESFIERSVILAREIAAVLKYLFYWIIPRSKILTTLVRDDPEIGNAVIVLRELGLRTNLDLLQHGITPTGRKALADASGLPEAIISALVNRADFSRLPWASKATISNIIGAGYGSLAQLAAADPQQLYTDFFRFGKGIGKNLRLGNEIENSYRIAKIMPVVLQID